ncbi:unnamed protein product [Aureobasidium uvarum]|uniref:Uncharacterized protein n=1 Tax=Aureobasidium uvarum TaxID=2773716 RepID=A0A9N8PWA7_9PEZI|nr:unnamed protein product [Aureobasidium uvarum]
MSIQSSHFLRLPIELRLMTYEHSFDNPDATSLSHSLTFVSEQVSEEVMPILLRLNSGYFWTAIPCDEEWYMAIRPRKRIWRMRLTNMSEKPLNTMPEMYTTSTYHLLVGRRMMGFSDFYDRLSKNDSMGTVVPGYGLCLEYKDQQDGVKRLMRERFSKGRESNSPVFWFERGRAGAPEINKRLTERVWHQQWHGGGRRGPTSGWMCRLIVDEIKDTR